MSNFKRSSRFDNNAPAQQARPRQTSSAGYSGGGKKSNFSRIGSLTVPKSVADDLRNVIMTDLRGSEIKLSCQVFLPEGAALELKKGDTLLVSFNTNEKDKDFVVGHLLVKN